MQEMEEKSVAFLETSVKNYRIFLDTCSILCEHADQFWSNILPVLQRENKTLVIPLRVYEEVKKFADHPKLCEQKSDPNLNRRAKEALVRIVKLQKEKIVEIFGGPQDNFADNVFQTVFTQFRLKYNLLLITQDQNLAEDILNIGKSKSVTTKNRILVRRINSYGYLGMFHYIDSDQPAPFRSDAVAIPKSVDQIPEEERFAIATSVRQVPGKLQVSSVPQEGSVLIAKRGDDEQTVQLEKAGPSGGEGTIYFTNLPGLVAKIYKPEKLTRARYEKLALMLTKKINCPGVCFPLALLYNQQNEFVGYLMQQAKGKGLQCCVFVPALLKQNFPNWTKVDTVTLCITILEKLKYLHDRNIILGDINPNNILVVSPTEVYFVDTDSYQIEGFPCPVGTINYTAPEIQRKEYSSFLRTMGNENFAVATLLFMIMLPGKPPYSIQGGENQIDNILNGDFAYAAGSRSNGKTPGGMWRYCWSHLPHDLKDDFYETFNKKGKHSTEDTRYSTDDWLKKFKHYLTLLKNGRLAQQDEMSLQLFPTRFKKYANGTYIKCKLCGREVDQDWTQEGICSDCLKKGEIYYCTRCGREMLYTNYQKYIKRSPKYKLCKECVQEMRSVYKEAYCVECGEHFTITYGEKEYFERMGYVLPTRCKNCRGRSSYASRTASSSGRKSRFGFCFITTAACEYFGKPDDCYELTALRQFRDGWLAVQPGGRELIQEYYRVAPPIVDALNQSSRRDEIYLSIWYDYILPCLKLIQEQDYQGCRELYEQMVYQLKDTVLKEKEV